MGVAEDHPHDAENSDSIHTANVVRAGHGRFEKVAAITDHREAQKESQHFDRP